VPECRRASSAPARRTRELARISCERNVAHGSAPRQLPEKLVTPWYLQQSWSLSSIPKASYDGQDKGASMCKHRVAETDSNKKKARRAVSGMDRRSFIGLLAANSALL